MCAQHEEENFNHEYIIWKLEVIYLIRYFIILWKEQNKRN